MTVTLSAAPLSRHFVTYLSSDSVPRTIYALPELRKLGWQDLMRTLWRATGPVVEVVAEDESSATLVPVLEVLAALTRCKRIVVRVGNRPSRQVSRVKALSRLFQIAYFSLDGQFSRAIIMRRARKLLRANAARRTLSVSSAGLYIKSNAWAGVKAGGSVGHVAGVLNAMCRRGFSMRLLAVDAAPGLDEEIEVLMVARPTGWGLPAEVNLYRQSCRTLTAAEAAVATTRPRWIYQRMSLGDISGAWIAHQRAIPLILEYNGSEVWIARNWGRRLRIERTAAAAEAAMLRQADVVVTVSDVLREDLERRGVDRRRIVVYPNCVDPRVFKPDRWTRKESLAFRREMGIPGNAVVVTFVGTFGRWHGAPVLARAAKLLLERGSTELHFVFVGDGLERPAAMEILRDATALDRVTWTGIVGQDEAPRFLAMSDILAAPHVANQDGSRFFGSPTKLFEYMAMGKAIVASDLEQLGSVLRNEAGAELARLVPPGDIERLAAAIAELALDSGERDRLGGLAASEALTRYTWSKHVDAILQGVHEALKLEDAHD